MYQYRVTARIKVNIPVDFSIARSCVTDESFTDETVSGTKILILVYMLSLFSHIFTTRKNLLVFMQWPFNCILKLDINLFVTDDYDNLKLNVHAIFFTFCWNKWRCCQSEIYSIFILLTKHPSLDISKIIQFYTLLFIQLHQICFNQWVYLKDLMDAHFVTYFAKFNK